MSISIPFNGIEILVSVTLFVVTLGMPGLVIVAIVAWAKRH